MEIIQGTMDFQFNTETAVAIGKFDGVHVGHQRLLEEILSCKDKKSCVLTFDPPPAVFFGLSDGKELTTGPEKLEILGRMGVDIVIEFPMTAKTAAMPAEEFVEEILADRLCAGLVAAGEDVSFGDRGAGDAELLCRLGQEYDFATRIIEKVCVDGEMVSSSRIRTAVEQGNMQMAERLLGNPYTLFGKVEQGRQIGRTLGFPTVNLLPPENKLLPPNGVYFSRVRHEGRLYRAISNVGCKPTVAAHGGMGVETFLYDFDGTLYGEPIEVELLEFWRPEKKFENLDFLKEQLERDVAAGKSYGEIYSV